MARWPDPNNRKKKRDNPEDRLQRSCIKYFDIKFSRYSKSLFAVPNGGKRSEIEAAIMVGLGVRKGVPDLFLCVFKHIYVFELKAGKNTLAPAQRDYRDHMREHAHEWHEIRSLDQFMEEVERIMLSHGVK